MRVPMLVITHYDSALLLIKLWSLISFFWSHLGEEAYVFPPVVITHAFQGLLPQLQSGKAIFSAHTWYHLASHLGSSFPPPPGDHTRTSGSQIFLVSLRVFFRSDVFASLFCAFFSKIIPPLTLSEFSSYYSCALSPPPSLSFCLFFWWFTSWQHFFERHTIFKDDVLCSWAQPCRSGSHFGIERPPAGADPIRTGGCSVGWSPSWWNVGGKRGFWNGREGRWIQHSML